MNHNKEKINTDSDERIEKEIIKYKKNIEKKDDDERLYLDKNKYDKEIKSHFN